VSRLVNPCFFADAYLVTIALAAHVGMFPWMYGMSESVAATPRSRASRKLEPQASKLR
jgi:hypothetical protein